MITINVANATNIQLNWLVANCVGFDSLAYEIKRTGSSPPYWMKAPGFAPTTDISQMWPLFEQYAVSYYIKKWDDKRPDAMYEVYIWNGEENQYAFGPTALVAMTRCFVMSKRGEIVEVPESLI